MHFETGYLYHIYNQGNNRQKIFFNRENYLFFLKKIRGHVKPYCDVLAWCLMPNHFHLMVRVNRCGSEGFAEKNTKGITVNQFSDKDKSQINASSETLAGGSLNHSIGVMLRSYTNSINNLQSRSGSLFRKKTKAICLNCPKGITPVYFDTEFGTQIYRDVPEKQYAQVCFNYIHQNPVKAGLVRFPEDWEFSSYADYAGLRGGQLVNKKVAKKYVSF